MKITEGMERIPKESEAELDLEDTRFPESIDELARQIREGNENGRPDYSLKGYDLDRYDPDLADELMWHIDQAEGVEREASLHESPWRDPENLELLADVLNEYPKDGAERQHAVQELISELNLKMKKSNMNGSE